MSNLDAQKEKIKELTKGPFTTEEQICEAITALGDIGQNKKLGKDVLNAIQDFFPGKIAYFSAGEPRRVATIEHNIKIKVGEKKLSPIYVRKIVDHTINILSEMPRATKHLGIFLDQLDDVLSNKFNLSVHRKLGIAVDPNIELRDKQFNQHKEKILKIIGEIGGQKAATVLGRLDDKMAALKALSQVDSEETAAMILDQSRIDLKDGIRDENITALNALVDLNKQVEDGIFKKVTKKSIRDAANKLCLALTPLELGLILSGIHWRDAYDNDRKGWRGYIYNPQTPIQPVPKEKISALQEAFQKAHDADIIDDRHMRLLEVAIQEHRGRQEADKIREELNAA